MRFGKVFVSALLAGSLLSVTAVHAADGRKAFRDDVLVGALAENEPLFVTPYRGRTVVQVYCGKTADVCTQYSATYQPYAPPVIYRVD
jgi:hypothetical protein